MNVAQIIPSLETRHGGPSQSVRALANHLVDSATNVALLATVEDAADVAAHADIANTRLFPRVTPRWLSRSPALREHLQTTAYDCIHHHSLWLLTLRYAHEAARTRRVPLVISPRGMMSPWAYQHHGWRKQLARRLIHPGAFEAASAWHATSEAEADDIRRLGFRQPICVSPNGVTLPDDHTQANARAYWHEMCPAARHRPVALFYSRLHRKKRVRELIDLWLSTSRGDWLLLVVGVPEEYMVDALQAELTTRGATDKIAVHSGVNCPPPYAIASLFVLPSHSENFGLVIAEALAAGVPALVTDTTPWQGLDAQGGGWCVPWANYGAALSRALALPPATLSVMGTAGRAWVERHYTWPQAAALLREFYRTLRS